MHWIDKIIRFGGTSLPNIIYGVNKPIEDWFEKILSWNSIFYDWYRLKRPNAEIIRIRQEIPFLFWTSDIHMNFLVDEKQEDALLTSAKELAKEKNLILNIKNVA
jgi:hypothetical protein